MNVDNPDTGKRNELIAFVRQPSAHLDRTRFADLGRSEQPPTASEVKSFLQFTREVQISRMLRIATRRMTVPAGFFFRAKPHASSSFERATSVGRQFLESVTNDVRISGLQSQLQDASTRLSLPDATLAAVLAWMAKMSGTPDPQREILTQNIVRVGDGGTMSTNGHLMDALGAVLGVLVTVVSRARPYREDERTISRKLVRGLVTNEDVDVLSRYLGRKALADAIAYDDVRSGGDSGAELTLSDSDVSQKWTRTFLAAGTGGLLRLGGYSVVADKRLPSRTR